MKEAENRFEITKRVGLFWNNRKHIFTFNKSNCWIFNKKPSYDSR